MLLHDSYNLKIYRDKEYRNKLLSSSRYPSLEYVPLEKIYVNIRLSRVFDNILSNAIKFTKEGSITIAAFTKK
jgi:signal transduction histidine kinase